MHTALKDYIIMSSDKSNSVKFNEILQVVIQLFLLKNQTKGHTIIFCTIKRNLNKKATKKHARKIIDLAQSSTSQ